MKLLRALGLCSCLAALATGSVIAGEKTCCQKADAQGKECAHKCCITAHKGGKSCQKCNPNKEDAKLIKKKSEKSPDKQSA
jgi:hypothetical protein